MYTFTFKLKPDALTPTKLPDITYAHTGVCIPGYLDSDDAVVEYHTFAALAVYESAITTLWPQAYDIEKGPEPSVPPTRSSGPNGAVWIKSQIPLNTGMFRIRFFVPGDDTRPMKYPPPHPAWNIGSGAGYGIWVGYFDNIEQLLEYWPDAFCIDIFESGLSEYRFSERMPKPNYLGQEPGTQLSPQLKPDEK